MHQIRYALVIGWLMLIMSLFFDPLSQYLTDPNTAYFSPLKDELINLAQDPATCIQLQGECLTGAPYAAGARIFWGFVVPIGFGIVFVLGHEFWRRICPLYFLSQIPRALGIKPLKQINQNKWLIKNHLYLQFGLFFLGLNMRILFVNSARPVLGGFLLFTIAAAIVMNLFYGGRSWCHYVCPFGMVQMVLTGPRGLLGSEAQKQPAKTVTQSMCRTFDPISNGEKITCISCKFACMDIDAEKSYWEDLNKPGRNLVQYGYLGLVCGYFIYYFLYSGNFEYYFSGAWTHEAGQVGKIFNPGFYLGGMAIPIPKLIATPLTLGTFVGSFYVVLNRIEKIYGSYLKRQGTELDKNIARHRVFTIVTFLAVNFFYVYGGRPEILRLPLLAQMLFNALVVLLSTFWFVRTWGRTNAQYKQESIADKLRRQLKKLKLNFTEVLGGRSLEDLKAGELGLLAQVLPRVTKQERIQVYKGVLSESLQGSSIDAAHSLEALQSVRQRLGVTEEEHYVLLTELGIDDPNLLKSAQEYPQEERLRIEGYQEAIASLLQELVDSGVPLHEAVQRKTKQIASLKQEYHVNHQEHFQVMRGLFDALRPKAEKLLALLQVENSRYQIISNFSSYGTVFLLLRQLLLAKQQLIVTPLLAVLELLHNQPDVMQLAQRTGIVASEAVFQVFKAEPQWQQRLNPQLQQALISHQVNSNQETVLFGSDDLASRPSIDNALLELLQEPNPITQAASLYALTQIDREQGLAQAQEITLQPTPDNLLKNTAASLLEQSAQPLVIEQLLSLSRQPNFSNMTPEQLLSIAI
ncbi:MAG: 4Fe-4S binding protein [Cyanobacteria bacterium J06621_8]